MSRYENSSIYKLCCNDPTITDEYVGSTCSFARRKSEHKRHSATATEYLYSFIRGNGGWDNWKMIQLLAFECANKREKELKEREYIELLRPTLNKSVPTRSPKEYYQVNKEHLKQLAKVYKEDNKKKVADYQKEYNIEYQAVNKDSLTEKKKQYYDNNKDELQKRQTARRATYVLCGCGAQVTVGSRWKHLKSKTHLEQR